MSLIYLNGEYVAKQEAKISVFDHGFLYGDGVFEGIRAYRGRVFKLHEHVLRLYDSAKAIMLTIPLDVPALEQVVLESCRQNRLQDGYIRVVVSRGDGDLGLDPRRCSRPNVVVIADGITLFPAELYEQGMRVATVATRRNIAEGVNPRIKSLNYLNNILAKIEANLAGYHEVLMLNHDGYVAEGTGDNVFVVTSGGNLLTPPAYAGCVEGITRNVIIELAQAAGIQVKEGLFTRYEVHVAAECFLTGTAAEVIPVTEVDGRVIGSGEPGEITRYLMHAYQQLVSQTGIPIYPEGTEDIAAGAAAGNGG